MTDDIVQPLRLKQKQLAPKIPRALARDNARTTKGRKGRKARARIKRAIEKRFG